MNEKHDPRLSALGRILRDTAVKPAVVTAVTVVAGYVHAWPHNY